MDKIVEQGHPVRGHDVYSYEALIDFLAYVEERNVDYRDTKTTKQDSEWPFAEFPQMNAVQEMYAPEPKQMPMICFNCGHTGIAYCFAT